MSAKATALEEIERRLDLAIDEAREYVQTSERAFLRAGAARQTLAALLRAGAIHPHLEDTVRGWMREGGYVTLTIRGHTIFPPEEP